MVDETDLKQIFKIKIVDHKTRHLVLGMQAKSILEIS